MTPEERSPARSAIDAIVDRAPLWGPDSDVPRKLPWNDPQFSRRMLAEHLDQRHDMASRRTERIERQVEWIFGTLLGGHPGTVLDLGCGPGLYTERLAARGCRCVGIDFSPAAIDHARAHAEASGHDCAYRLEDLGAADLGTGFDLVMMLFGELNTFDRETAADLLKRAAHALDAGGTLLLEAHVFDSIVRWGRTPPSWFAKRAGLFSDGHHLVLNEQEWNDDAAATRARYIVLDAAGAGSATYGEEVAAYTDDDYRLLMASSGLASVEILPGMGEDREAELQVIVARRPG